MSRLCSSILLATLLLVACTPELPSQVAITPATALPTQDINTLCSLGQDAAQDWDVRLNALKDVRDRAQTCDTPIEQLLYEAHIEFGQFMARSGDRASAVAALENALRYVPDGELAQEVLATLTAPETTPEAVACEDGTEATVLAPYQPTSTPFADLSNASFTVDGRPFAVYGVNYYPMNTPFELFLTESDLEAIDMEFALIRETGINTLRIFLRPQDLFECDAVVPARERFELLDGIIQLAADHGLRLIPVLNADVIASVLYFEPHVNQQAAFIVERYRDEGLILAWDVRDRGDVDYRTGLVRQDVVLNWLAETVVLLRQVTDRQAITAGWWQDSLTTAPLVDFVSFQFYGDYEDLRQEIASLRASAGRPVLLSAIGYSTHSVSDITQRNLLFQAFEEVENNRLMGWMVNHAFDYPRSVTCIPPDCPGPGTDLNQYGLWNTGYFPKLAVEAVRITTGVDE